MIIDLKEISSVHLHDTRIVVASFCEEITKNVGFFKKKLIVVKEAGFYRTDMAFKISESGYIREEDELLEQPRINIMTKSGHEHRCYYNSFDEARRVYELLKEELGFFEMPTEKPENEREI